MFHYRHHAFHARDEVHRATRTFDHLSRDHPIRDVAAVGNFECAENRKIDMAAANLTKRIGAREKGRARHRSDRLFAGVDQIGVHFVFGRERTDAKQAVLGLQGDMNSFRNVIGHQCRNTDPEIDIVPVAQFLGGAFCHQIANGR